MKYKLSDICEYAKEKVDVSLLTNKTYISTENMLPNKSGVVDATSLPATTQASAFKVGDTLVSNIRPYFKKICYATFSGGCSNDVLVFHPKGNIDSKFLYYVLSDDDFFEYSTATSKGTKMPRGDKKAIMEYLVPDFPIEVQVKIAYILKSLDDKIELNNAINKNLEEQAEAIYRSMFVDNENVTRFTCRADEYFDISIGKTPPRKEPEWFSENPDNCVWVSISDMGSCGLYISDSSEYLTPEAVNKFNVRVVPDNTVILSFKLTVGRVAITDGMMTTNEAIAHFKTDKHEINEYLYCYLKNFNYQTMGSTSSIATAVNSKIIKAMPFVIPNENELKTFHSITAPCFEMIKQKQQENNRLVAIRDSLLPKLMSGEIDVSNVSI